MTRRALWVGLYAVAMAAVESAVVVYLRALHPIDDAPTAALLAVLPDRLIAVEVGREVATIVMLAAVAALAAGDRWGRFLYFSMAFGVWDIFYYFWLWVFIGWPPSLLTWDVLFLIPVPWLGPVLAPVIVSLCLVAGAWWLLALQARGVALRFPPLAWGLAALGAALILVSFTIDYRFVLERQEPDAFRWGLFGAGVALGGVGFGVGVRAANPGPRP